MDRTVVGMGVLVLSGWRSRRSWWLRNGRQRGYSAAWAEPIPRPYSRAEENARELNGDVGMTQRSGDGAARRDQRPWQRTV